jgi:hypothetical protein
MVQPRSEAKSPMNAVTTPIMIKEQQKQSQPLQKSEGGMMAKSNFHGRVRKCKNHIKHEGLGAASSSSPSSPPPPPPPLM